MGALVSYFTEEYNSNLSFSNKIKIIESGKKYIINKINSNQNIVRLCRYLTKTPLMKIGVDYNNKKIRQPDLNCGLDKMLADEECPNVEVRGQVLVPYAFSDELQPEEQINIFVNARNASFNNELYKSSRYKFDIIITYTATYNILAPFGDERALKIAEQICYELDGKYNDEDSQKDIGELQFTVSNINSIKVGKTGTMGWVMEIIAKPTTTDRELINNID